MGNSKLTNLELILLLIFIWPIGLLLMWKHNIWSKNTRTFVTIFCVVPSLLLSLAVNSVTNYKTYDKSSIDIGKLDLDADLYEEIPLLDQVVPPPAPLVKPSSNQNKIVFTDGKSVNLSILNNQLIDVVGASNFPVSKSTIKQFLICFFGKIGSTNSYKTYQNDLKKAENYSNDKEERTYFLFSLNYINSALWSCMNENPEFLEEYSKVDKIIPQSDLKIKAFAEVHLAEIKKEMGKVKFIEMSKVIDWERYSECFARKMWENFTPKEMYDMSPKNEKKREEMHENCMEVNLK